MLKQIPSITCGPAAQRVLVPSPQFARVRGITDRTVYNWEKSGILPAPVRINGRKYHYADTQPKFDGVAE